MEVQLVEVGMPEDDTVPDLQDVCSLSEYKEAAISYITGFVVRKMKEKITCLPCSQALPTDGAAHDFIHLKDRWSAETITSHGVCVSDLRPMYSEKDHNKWR